MNISTKLLSLLFFISLNVSIWAQTQGPKDIAFRFLEEKQAEWGLEDADLYNIAISDYYYGKMEKTHHFYFNQTFQNIKVHNAINSVHINDAGKAICVTNNFIPNLASKINVNSPSIDQVAAVQSVCKNLEIPLDNFQFKTLERNSNKVKFEKGKISNADINVNLVYQKVNNNEYRLAWDVSLDPVDQSDYWSIRVDAVDGKILDKKSWTVHCNFDHADDKNHDHNQCASHSKRVNTLKAAKNANGNASNNEASVVSGTYNVFADVINGSIIPYESPNHGPRNLLVTPHDPLSNPFGWHDTNGQDGPEYTITRGNNCHAYLDLVDDNTPEYSPDGGNNLNFDFPWDPNNEPDIQQDAAVTNVFFMCNYLHDISYAYGFDEASGNFQANNYGNHPTGQGDFVLVEAQDGADLNDGDHENNANFATPGDGGNPRMQMYVWTRAGGRLLNVLSPSSIAGLYQTATAAFGPALENTPIIDKEIALAFDDTTEPSNCCSPIINRDEIEGKIAMIDRGGCFFETKVVEAEKAGAVAAIICNYEDGVATLGATIDVDDPGIPSVMLSKPDCDLLKSFISEGITVSLELPENSGPELYDGDYDNGIIAHEFGHGISNRLTGGPNNTGCLSNEEQMGEGWSDFMTLITTTTSANTPEQKRGIGTWVSRENTNGNGIRPKPYSTDMTVNPLTFDDVPGLSIPHGLGTVWCSMLWDLYWAMTELHGFDDDIVNGTGGNNKAVQLVFTGMKLQGCSPGFQQGRDGILAADELLFNGDHQCLIWEVFARRGMGYFADSEDTNSAGDGISDYNPLPTCIKELKITKDISGDEEAKSIVAAGGSVEISINLINHKDDAVTNVILTDEFPDGTNPSNISNGGTVSGNMITWELGTMETLDEMTITYDLNTDEDNPSLSYWKDDIESGADNWVPLSNPNPSNNLDENNFEITQTNAFSGESSWFIENILTESIENLLLLEEYTVVGTNPGIRFFHYFDTHAGHDAGYIQISTDGAETWQTIGSEIFRNTYPRAIDYGSFVIPFLSGYSGKSNGYIDTWIDLNAFLGETVNLRFRYATDDTSVDGEIYDGWYIDDFEYIDIITYNGEACVTSDEGDNACQILPDRGIKIEPQESPNAADDIEDPSLDFNAFPNPANNFVNLTINNIKATNTSMTLINSSGSVVKEQALDLHYGLQNISLDVSELPSGFYFVRLNTEKGVAVEKIMVQHH